MITTRLLHCLTLLALAAPAAFPQARARDLTPILETQILSPDVADLQLRDYLVRRVKPLPEPPSAAQWTDTARQLRQQLLHDAVLRGWPEAWVNSPPRFEEVEVLPGNGYRVRKLRYEIVPGFHSAALLYEPETLRPDTPAILNVNGHGAPGKSMEFKQKRCITFAQNGIMALDLEWMSYGEMAIEGNQHIFGAHLDLAGTSGLGLFYLAMRRGIDYLHAHPSVDREQIGMTGLSGGGWQTIVLSALDERVRVSVPVAGFSSTVTRVEDYGYGDLGDFEQNAPDMLADIDYPHLVAMRAPRPTLLAYNAEDDCCFRGPVAKPFIFDAVQPFFALYNASDDFRWHENSDPGTHNYQLDNRRQAYRFFAEQFGLPTFDESADIGSEVRSATELTVGMPPSNLTILGLARQLAGKIERPALPENSAARDAARKRLREVIRLEANPIDRLWTIAMTKNRGVETRSHIFAMKDGLSAAGLWLRPIDGPKAPAATIILDDRGRAESVDLVADRINRGEQVLALDLSFTGEPWKEAAFWRLQQVVVAQGQRPLGIRVTQLLELANWLKDKSAGGVVRIETTGIRSQVTALTAAALHPVLFTEIVVRDGMDSLAHVYEKPIRFSDAPGLFCLDFYKETDLGRLAQLAAPTTIKSQAP